PATTVTEPPSGQRWIATGEDEDTFRIRGNGADGHTPGVVGRRSAGITPGTGPAAAGLRVCPAVLRESRPGRGGGKGDLGGEPSRRPTNGGDAGRAPSTLGYRVSPDRYEREPADSCPGRPPRSG